MARGEGGGRGLGLEMESNKSLILEWEKGSGIIDDTFLPIGLGFEETEN